MSLFSQQNHIALQDVSAHSTDLLSDVEVTVKKLAELHQKIFAKFSHHNLDLHPINTHTNVVFESASTSTKKGVIALQYMRSRLQALQVERLMGRDDTTNNGIEARRHPVIEVRVTSEYLTVELILSPYAWWDQQNFIGKMSVEHHKDEMFHLLQKLDRETTVGFWRGTQLEEEYVKVKQFTQRHIWNEWISTFDAGRDWLRMGIWYLPETDPLHHDTIVNEIVKQICNLYIVYEEILWSSNNNYREFYKSSRTNRY